MARKLGMLGASALMASLAGVGLGCASRSPAFIAPGHEGAPGVQRVLLGPMNLVVSLRPEISDGAMPTQRQIVAYLEAHGREVELLHLAEGRAAWQRAFQAAKDEGEPSGAAGRFLRTLAENRDFQALVMPSLFVHSTRVVGSRGSWNGVKRRMEVVNAPALATGRDQNTFAEGVAYGGIDGEVAVTSLHVLILSRDGERVFEGRGGLEFLHEIDMLGAQESYRYKLRMRSGLLQHSRPLREGIEIAFTPYLSPLAEP